MYLFPPIYIYYKKQRLRVSLVPHYLGQHKIAFDSIKALIVACPRLTSVKVVREIGHYDFFGLPYSQQLDQLISAKIKMRANLMRCILASRRHRRSSKSSARALALPTELWGYLYQNHLTISA